jgi:hypothetical protein
VCESLRFALSDVRRPTDFRQGFSVPALALHGLGEFLLIGALFHQLRHRGAGGGGGGGLGEGLLDDGEVRGRSATLDYLKVVFKSSPLFLAYVLLLSLKLAMEGHSLFLFLFLASFFLLKAPSLFLASRIVLSRASHHQGPTHTSRLFLALAVCLNLASDMPLEIWTTILPDNCAFGFASWVDFVLLLYVASLPWFFVFARNEFLRTREEYLVTEAQEIQDRFDKRAI